MRITREKQRETIAELNRLLGKRISISNDLATALSYGDLPENSAFDAARERWILNERRIFELEDILKRSKVVDRQRNDRVTFGSRVLMKINDTEKEYQIVDSIEADPASGKISIDSPIGRALIGRKSGAVVPVKFLDKVKNVRILKVS